MARLIHILLLVMALGCAGANSTVHRTSDQSQASDASGKTSASSVPEVVKVPSGQRSSEGVSNSLAEHHREILRQWDEVVVAHDFTDGIDRLEAAILGEAYFLMKFGGCGVNEDPQDGGYEWLLRPRVGVTGRAVSDFIRIDKRTGTIRYGSGQVVEAKTALEFERNILQKNVERFSRRSLGGEPANSRP